MNNDNNDNKKKTARSYAHSLLLKAEGADVYSNIILDKLLSASDLCEADKGLVSVLFYGVTERKLTLDYQISRRSARPIGEIDLSTLTALRMGLYQLAFLDRIPPHAAINETVELCSKKAAGFVNAILRAYTRDGGLLLPDREDDPVYYLSVAYSAGQPLVKKLIESFGEERAEGILKGFSRIPPTTARVNTLRATREELLDAIPDSRPTEFSDKGITLTGAVRNTYGFSEGKFFVQDEASQICVEALGAKSGETVMDICACPGSKSFGAAIDMNNKGQLLSFDLHEKKLSLIVSGAERLGIDIIKASANDGRNLLSEYVGKADRVLCDVPCSGFGVLSKKPELRYKDPEVSAALPKIQRAILDTACQYLRIGGTLVYSTCTILPEENENNILSFLDSHKDFELVPFSVGSLDVPKGYITLFPDLYPTDGFFIAKLVKKA